MRKFFLAAALAVTPFACAPQDADAHPPCCVPVAPVQVVPMQVVPVVPACAYTTRWRPFLGGWVTRGRQVWIPATAAAPQPAAPQK
jgi:hypothetical protein